MDDYEGDGLEHCDHILPQIVSLSPSEGHTDSPTIVNVSFVYPVKDAHSRQIGPTCKFGSSTVLGKLVTSSILQCVVPGRPAPVVVPVSVTFDGRYWSNDDFTFSFTSRIGFSDVLPLVIIYGIAVIGMAAVAAKLITRRHRIDPGEKEAFLGNEKGRSMGVRRRAMA
jgi:hypothetical protein